MKRDRQVAKLKARISALENSNQVQMLNAVSGIVDAASMQTSMTSFLPMLQNNIYAPLTINWTLLTYLYKTHGIIQTAIDMPVLDALRGGLEIRADQLGADEVEQLEKDFERDGYLDVIREAGTWARLYGGGGVVINVDQDPAKPLDLARLQGSRFELYAAARWELEAPHQQSEFFTYYGKRMHRSRVITILGKAAPYIIRWQLSGWGMSEVERMVEDFNRYIKTCNVLYEVLEEAKVDVYGMKGLNAAAMTAAGQVKIQQRIQMANQVKNFHRALILDSEDKFEQKSLTFSGLAEVMKENRIGIASALRIPMTKLFGLSASGFNSGEDDIENYNAMVESEVRQPLRKVIREVLKVYSHVVHGADMDLGFEYRPLRVLSAVEEENVKKSKQERILLLYDRQLMDSTEVGQAVKKEKLMPMELNAAKGLLDDHPVTPEQEAAAKAAEEGGRSGEGGEAKNARWAIGQWVFVDGQRYACQIKSLNEKDPATYIVWSPETDKTFPVHEAGILKPAPGRGMVFI